jgi:hypothetical protein
LLLVKECSPAFLASLSLSLTFVGGGLVMLAWLARGDAEALVGYLPDDLQEFPPLATLQRWQDAFASLTAVPLPPASQDLVGRIGVGCRFLVVDSWSRLARRVNRVGPLCVLANANSMRAAQVDGLVADLSALLNDLLPPISVSYWALLMVLAAIAFVPAAAARSNPDFAKARALYLRPLACLWQSAQQLAVPANQCCCRAVHAACLPCLSCITCCVHPCPWLRLSSSLPGFCLGTTYNSLLLPTFG